MASGQVGSANLTPNLTSPPLPSQAGGRRFDRVTAGIERRAKERKWATGRLPFGFTGIHAGSRCP